MVLSSKSPYIPLCISSYIFVSEIVTKQSLKNWTFNQVATSSKVTVKTFCPFYIYDCHWCVTRRVNKTGQQRDPSFLLEVKQTSYCLLSFLPVSGGPHWQYLELYLVSAVKTFQLVDQGSLSTLTFQWYLRYHLTNKRRMLAQGYQTATDKTLPCTSVF